MLVVLALLICDGMVSVVSAQSWLKGLGERAVNKVKEKIEDKVEDKAGEAVDGAFEGKIGRKKPSDKSEANGAVSSAAKGKGFEASYAKSDFVPGDEIFFEDDFAKEKLGEFPSKWDLLEGNAEVARMNGRPAIFLESPSTKITPLMKIAKHYLTDEFTLEFDYFQGDPTITVKGDKYTRGGYYVRFYANDENKIEYFFNEEKIEWSIIHPTTGNEVRGELPLVGLCKLGEFNHFALSFNKRALKVYINGQRVSNIPNASQTAWFDIQREAWEDHAGNYITNVRLTKGAVPLYERLVTDGKIVTYAITFDVGLSIIKPESMTEISRIQKLMQENPSLKFEVQGHTDNTGSAAANLTLSQARAKAIVDKMVSLGISASRLTAVGKGQSSPIADNSTDEGRSKNRRVEFVKR
jgi:outer membrane protein OmpA-like peptidoglycan-associated protein